MNDSDYLKIEAMLLVLLHRIEALEKKVTGKAVIRPERSALDDLEREAERIIKRL